MKEGEIKEKKTPWENYSKYYFHLPSWTIFLRRHQYFHHLFRHKVYTLSNHVFTKNFREVYSISFVTKKILKFLYKSTMKKLIKQSIAKLIYVLNRTLLLKSFRWCSFLSETYLKIWISWIDLIRVRIWVLQAPRTF